MFLGIDGLLILRFVKDHAGSRVAGEIAHELFVIYRKNMGYQISNIFT